jgi:hypothetical protein
MTPQVPVTPPQSTPLSSPQDQAPTQDALFAKIWWLFLEGIRSAVNYLNGLDFVFGGSTLVDDGSVPMVTGQATIGESMILQFGGNIGIGTPVPAYPLDVAGDINISVGSVYRIAGIPIASTLGFPGAYASVALTGQSAPITTTNIRHSVGSTMPAGRYWIMVYAETTTTGTGNLTLTIGWHTPAAAKTEVLGPQGMTPVGAGFTLGFEAVTDGVNELTYAMADSGTGTYSLYIDVQRWA